MYKYKNIYHIPITQQISSEPHNVPSVPVPSVPAQRTPIASTRSSHVEVTTPPKDYRQSQAKPTAEHHYFNLDANPQGRGQRTEGHTHSGAYTLPVGTQPPTYGDRTSTLEKESKTEKEGEKKKHGVLSGLFKSKKDKDSKDSKSKKDKDSK